jgi:transposase InsO family protein
MTIIFLGEPSENSSKSSDTIQIMRIKGLPGFKDTKDQMQEFAHHGKMARRRRPRTTRTNDTHPVAPNLLNRQFSGKKRHEVWLTDIAYIETAEGYLYLGSREIIGLAMAEHLRTELVDKALDMALIQHCPPGGIMHHSDRGSQILVRRTSRNWTITASSSA